MATLTVYADLNDDCITSSASNWAGARAGSGTLALQGSTSGAHGWGYNRISSSSFVIFEDMIAFDTSGVGSGSSVTAVSMTVTVFVGATNPLSNGVRIRLYDWSASGVDTGDYRATDGTSATDTLLADTTDTFFTTGDKTFTENGTNFQTNINKTGFTYLYGVAKSPEDNSTLTSNGSRVATVYAGDNTGTTNDPQLDITYTPAGGSSAATKVHSYRLRRV